MKNIHLISLLGKRGSDYSSSTTNFALSCWGSCSDCLRLIAVGVQGDERQYFRVVAKNERFILHFFLQRKMPSFVAFSIRAFRAGFIC